jgi:hypothetical protein
MTSHRSSDQKRPPYVPYKTWVTLIEKLRVTDEAEQLPQQLDSSVWEDLGFNGVNRSALKNALVFLGLTTDDYRPTPVMAELIRAWMDISERQRQLRRMLNDCYYSAVGHLDLARVTRQDMRKALAPTGSSAQTADKAVSFYVTLAAAAGGPVLNDRLKPRAPKIRRRDVSSVPKTTDPDDIVPKKITENDDQPAQIAQPFVTEKTLHPLMQALVDELTASGEQWEVGKKQMFDDVWEAAMTYVYGHSGSTNSAT